MDNRRAMASVKHLFRLDSLIRSKHTKKMIFEPVIGLEIHAQLLTESKLFCRCCTAFGGAPNSQTCPICLGLSGVLPVLNNKAVEYAIKMGLAIHCKIAPFSIFARKNYFYPDLPKGYQISQYGEPLCQAGFLEFEIDNQPKKIGIQRIHLEEDAGKSIHAESWVESDETLIDFNRCGVPLIEIVSEPEIHSPQEAYLILTELRQILLYLEINDGNLEQGSLRCDANISFRPKGSKKLGTKTELKNINSFHGVLRALQFEVQRQQKILADGGTVQQETLLWDDKNSTVIPMRTKEMAHDYRYFPEPDLVPLRISQEQIEKIKSTLPELPSSRRKRLFSQYHLSTYQVNNLTENKNLADYFEAVAALTKNPQSACNWILGEVKRVLNENKQDITEFAISPRRLSGLLNLVSDDKINLTIAKSVFEKMKTTHLTAEEIIKKEGWVPLSDKQEIERYVELIIAENTKEVQLLKSGKSNILQFLMGQVMKVTKGKANPQLVKQILIDKLNFGKF